VLLPVLVAGPVLGGAAIRFHAHGAAGEHVHVVADVDHVHVHDFHAGHAAAHGHELPAGEKHDEPTPTGLLVEFPRVIAAVAKSADVPSSTGSVLRSVMPLASWSLSPSASTHRPGLCRSSWPPQPSERSGVAVLLRSSHALLI
jgi:hypothetical protein